MFETDLGSLDLILAMKDWTDPRYWQWLQVLALLGGLVGVGPITEDPKVRGPAHAVIALRRTTVTMAILAIAFPLLLWTRGVPGLLSEEDFIDWWCRMAWHYSPGLIAGVILGFALQYLLIRRVAAAWSDLFRRWRINQATQSEADIRQEMGKYEPITFDPTKYFKPSEVFFGLDRMHKPVRLKLDDFHGNHLQIVGPTGCGKSTLFGCLLAQAIERREFTMLIDPGEDDRLRDVLFDYAGRYSRPYVYYDMGATGQGAWDPFAGGRLEDRRARVITALGLADAETDADVYKSRERNQVDAMFLAGCHNLRAMQGWILANAPRDDQGELHLSKVAQRIQEFAQHPAFLPAPDRGFKVAQSIENNAVVYVRGDISMNPLIRAASRVLLLEIIQELTRLEKEGKRKVPAFVLFDEAKFLVSNPLVAALALLRKRRVVLGIAHQSLLDMYSIDDPNMDKRATADGIDINTQIKFVYRQKGKSAEIAAQNSGPINITITKAERTEVTHAGAEQWGDTRTLSELKTTLIQPATIMALQPRVGMLDAPGRLAQIVYTCYVVAKERFTPREKAERLPTAPVVPTPPKPATNKKANTSHRLKAKHAKPTAKPTEPSASMSENQETVV